MIPLFSVRLRDDGTDDLQMWWRGWAHVSWSILINVCRWRKIHSGRPCELQRWDLFFKLSSKNAYCQFKMGTIRLLQRTTWGVRFTVFRNMIELSRADVHSDKSIIKMTLGLLILSGGTNVQACRKMYFFSSAVGFLLLGMHSCFWFSHISYLIWHCGLRSEVPSGLSSVRQTRAAVTSHRLLWH